MCLGTRPKIFIFTLPTLFLLLSRLILSRVCTFICVQQSSVRGLNETWYDCNVHAPLTRGFLEMGEELVKGTEMEELSAENPMVEMKEGEANAEPWRTSWEELWSRSTEA